MEFSPRTNTELFGHDEAEALLLAGLKSGKLAHGWIIGGPKGIGKATLAYRFARTLLTSPSPLEGEGRDGGQLIAPPPNPLPQGEGENALRRILTGSHTDLLIIEPEWDAKKEEYARDISVDQAREIARFLSLTPAEGDWRLVIVDGADLLGPAAANAILKILEEPPAQSVLLLVTHQPGRLLPTIRSRCQMLRLSPLSDDEFAQAMRHIAPDIAEEELATLAQLSGHAPGVALEMRKEGVALYGQLLELLSSLPKIDLQALHGFADEIGSGTVHANWQLLTRLMLCLLSRVAISAAGGDITPVSPEEARVLERLGALHSPAVWAAKWQQCAEQFSLAEARHLDYKQLVITFIHSLVGSGEFALAAG